jgi:hypothetical protein
MDRSEASEGERFIGGRKGEAGVFGWLKESSEPEAPNDRLSTSSEWMSSMTDLIVGEFAYDLLKGGEGARKEEFEGDGRTGKAYEGGARADCAETCDPLAIEALSNASGEADRGKGK